ncbi:HlyU family transcriptional regulator [Aeromonas hydrophila]|uniref:HlyU family transcriptional regulator n=1 Tax=Aeromonas hydrophila TaxID=644 RepID=UPI001CEFB7DD|nr:HlyU family transcriptional regulator [Aeromonas hydrophila]MCK0185885.1 HlyU family transcriptional regulator [Aeromonas hydrophila]UCM58050.1 transcriptional regulator [Aeromonas hydrophila]UOV92513.1 HlyU family transcriptional regulator [Aeromonas hydrophila]
MLKKLFTALFGGQPAAAAEVTPTEYAGYLIYPEPMAEGGQYRLAGRITKELDGVLQTHRFIRSDLFANPADAERFMVQKAHTFIDQMGDRMFEPRVKAGNSSAS